MDISKKTEKSEKKKVLSLENNNVPKVLINAPWYYKKLTLGKASQTVWESSLY